MTQPSTCKAAAIGLTIIQVQAQLMSTLCTLIKSCACDTNASMSYCIRAAQQQQPGQRPELGADVMVCAHQDMKLLT